MRVELGVEYERGFRLPAAALARLAEALPGLAVAVDTCEPGDTDWGDVPGTVVAVGPAAPAADGLGRPETPHV